MYKSLHIFLLWVLSACNPITQKNIDLVTKDTSTSFSTGIVKITDTSYFPYLIDTNVIFNNLKKLLVYKNNKLDKILEYIRNLETISVNIAEIRFKNDSILFLNETFSAILMKKYIEQADKNVLTLRCLENIIKTTAITDSEKMKLFYLFPEQLRKGSVGQKILNKLREFEVNYGTDIQQFNNSELSDVDGRKINFQDLFKPSYEYYVMIFGASWCRPCRYGNILLKKHIQDLDTNNIKFIDFSMDKDAFKWKKSLEEDDLSWKCVWLRKNFQSEMAVKLKIVGVPRIFLVDKNQKIITEHFDIEFILKKIKSLGIPPSRN